MSAPSNPLPWQVSPSHVKRKCDICKRPPKKNETLDEHISRAHPTCNLCQNGTHFKSKQNLLNHKINAHGNNASKRIKFSGLHNLANLALASASASASSAANNEETNTNEENHGRSRSRSRSPRRKTKNNKKKGGYRCKYRTRRH